MKRDSNRLRVVRADRRLTQRMIASRTHITQTRISSIELGYIEPTESEQKRIARALKASLIEVFPNAIVEPPPPPDAVAS